MSSNVQTTSHPGLNAWFELLRTERCGRMPKYWVAREHRTVQCSYPACEALSIELLVGRSWGLRQRDGSSYLFAFRHHGLCPWQQRVGSASQYSFTTQPLERAYLYWAKLERKLNHK